ncbi:MAG: stage II sporulation protein R [Oscillospiraceae bacterium]|nr:stage II sporulation protein R [Oscillospiraceae bacterium]
MKLKKWELALIMALCVTALLGIGALREQRQLADRLIRLHVVANSDSQEDQEIKLAVRDRVQQAIEPWLHGVANREEAVAIIGQNINKITSTVEDTLLALGKDHSIRVIVGEEHFPARMYDTFTLPAGRYQALRVEIGESAGGNWWCVVFPPLCTDSAVHAADALNELSEDQITLITGSGRGHVVKFRTLEWIARVRAFFAS